MKVDKKTFHWLVDSWAVSCEMDDSDKAHALLTRMEDLDLSSTHGTMRPDVRSLTKDINAISRSGSADAGDMTDKIMEVLSQYLARIQTMVPGRMNNEYWYTIYGDRM